MFGNDGGKKLSGRKRHLLVDTQGFVLNAVVQEAELTEHNGAYEVLNHLRTRFPPLKHVRMDMGYRSERLRQWLTTQRLEQEIVQKPRCWVEIGASVKITNTGRRQAKSGRISARVV